MASFSEEKGWGGGSNLEDFILEIRSQLRHCVSRGLGEGASKAKNPLKGHLLVNCHGGRHHANAGGGGGHGGGAADVNWCLRGKTVIGPTAG